MFQPPMCWRQIGEPKPQRQDCPAWDYSALVLQDLRVTPVGEVYPGVESHANVLSGGSQQGNFQTPLRHGL